MLKSNEGGFGWVDCKLNHQTRRTMSHSARAGAKGKMTGRNAPSIVYPPIPLNTSSSTPPASAPSAASGAHAPLNLVLARQQAQEKKYPLWKYVTRKEGLGENLGGGGNVCWTCNFCKNEFKSTYYRVKGHLLALSSCGIYSCKSVSVSLRRDMGKEDQEGLGNVAAASKKKNEDLPFLRKPSSIRPPFPPSRGDAHPAKKRPSSSGPMDKIFQQEA